MAPVSTRSYPCSRFVSRADSPIAAKSGAPPQADRININIGACECRRRRSCRSACVGNLHRVEPGCDPNHQCPTNEMITSSRSNNGVRSCPPYSTSSFANTAVPASPRCGNSFFWSRLKAVRPQKRIAMSAKSAPVIGLDVLATIGTKLATFIEPARLKAANGGVTDVLSSADVQDSSASRRAMAARCWRCVSFGWRPGGSSASRSE